MMPERNALTSTMKPIVKNTYGSFHRRCSPGIAGSVTIGDPLPQGDRISWSHVVNRILVCMQNQISSPPSCSFSQQREISDVACDAVDCRVGKEHRNNRRLTDSHLKSERAIRVEATYVTSRVRSSPHQVALILMDVTELQAFVANKHPGIAARANGCLLMIDLHLKIAGRQGIVRLGSEAAWYRGEKVMYIQRPILIELSVPDTICCKPRI